MSRSGLFVISGAGSGIGQAIAVKLASCGHHVFGLGRSESKLQSTASLVANDCFHYQSCDISDATATSQAVAAIRETTAQLKLPLLGVVNNAGIFSRAAFNEVSDQVWSRYFEVNLLSAVRLTRELYLDLKASKPSSVLNISSTLGQRPLPSTLPYSALKAAMINWTQGLALEWASDGIRVNAICPGIVDTPIHAFHTEGPQSEVRRQMDQAQPLGRVGKAEDIAESAYFLMSEQSPWTTGSILTVDGGISL